MSPCDGNSHEEIPTETYQSYPGKASREPRGVEFTAPRRENGPKFMEVYGNRIRYLLVLE